MKMLVNTVPPIIATIAPAVTCGPREATVASLNPVFVIVSATSNAALSHEPCSTKWKNSSTNR